MLRTVTTVPATGAELSSCDELSIFLSAGCNLNCAYCHIKKEVSVGTKLSAEAIEKAIGLFLKAGSTTKKQICFTGGEPFLQGELLRSASSFARRMTPAHIQLSLNIVTNATLLQESDLSFLRGNNIDLK
ncbi:MAG: radical SAM protein, partial [Candidatus Omnitrophota bacterium]|nr:radical SAM protein [Candidatus Omnitrophota bacterium]